MRARRTKSTVLGLALGLLGAACGAPGPNVTLPAGGDVHLTLLHTADWHSRLFPYQMTVSATDQNLGLVQSNGPFGGAARMNWLIHRERSRADRVLHLDSGDCFQGAPIFNFFSGEAETRALAHTGVDAVLIGNHEFDRGAANLYRQYSRWATFPILAANYQWEDPTLPGSAELGRISQPYRIFNLQGLKVAVIGMGNLSSITSVFDQRNSTGIAALNTRETAQFYVDLVQAQGADIVVMLTHLGLTEDDEMVKTTTGIDVVLGGHLHIVTDPPQQLQDCAPFDENGRHFVPSLTEAGRSRPSLPCNEQETGCCSTWGVCEPQPARAAGANGDPRYLHWRLAPGYAPRYCNQRSVLVQHSGAFMKYLGRLDLVVSSSPDRIGPERLGGDVANYRAYNRYEVVSHQYTLYPVDSTVPEEPSMARLLEPYALSLNTIANLDNLIGYAPNVVSRTNVGGGDSPMGNLVTTAMWRRLGVQTDLALTNSLGIRDAFPAGPIRVDQVYNVFPFDNSITTLQLSGYEVREMFDFVARRSAGRGCNSQSQISGARVVLNCGGCDRDGMPGQDTQLDDMGQQTPITACAETINIGLTNRPCASDAECNTNPNIASQSRSLCDPRGHVCMQPLLLTASYALAANDYIAGGGSGFFVLQRNTTQVNTGVQLRDALIDYVQNAPPCGYDPAVASMYRAGHQNQAARGDDGLLPCMADADCGSSGNYVCSCAGRFGLMNNMCLPTRSCGPDEGRCVLAACVRDLSAASAQACPTQSGLLGPGPRDPACACAAHDRAGESCRILSCIDGSIGAQADSRLVMRSE